jgi:hypothetical protein
MKREASGLYKSPLLGGDGLREKINYKLSDWALRPAKIALSLYGY